MRADVLVGLAAVTMAVLAPSDGAAAPAVLASPAEPPYVMAPPAPTADLVIAEMAVPAPPTTTTTAPPPTTTTTAPPPPTTTTTAAPLPPTTTPASTTTEPPATTVPEPEPEPEPEEEPEEVAPAAVEQPTLGGGWAELRACESGGDYGAVSSGGTYTGAYQFDRSTWASVGGTGRAGDASAAEQDMRAQMLYERRGAQPWPYCGRYL